HGNKYYALVKSFKASSTEIILARREMLNMTYGMQTGSRVRYAPKAQAIQIREEVSTFLRDKPKLSFQAENNTYYQSIKNQKFCPRNLNKHNNSLIRLNPEGGWGHKRASFDRIRLCIPIDILIEKLSQMGACDIKGTPKAVTKCIFLNVGEIINKCMAVNNQQMYGCVPGYYNYFSFTDDIHSLLRIIYVLRYSAINTVARKPGLNTAKHNLNFPRSLPTKRMNFALSPPSDPRVLFDTSCAAFSV
ncbi:hypothetical protein MARPO_0004s0310, partial [Marchantia polymorpha]